MKCILNYTKRLVVLFIIVLNLLVLVACSTEMKHAHTYSDEWTSNESHHWYSATCGHTSESIDNAEHEWEQGTETKAATETE